MLPFLIFSSYNNMYIYKKVWFVFTRHLAMMVMSWSLGDRAPVSGSTLYAVHKYTAALRNDQWSLILLPRPPHAAPPDHGWHCNASRILKSSFSVWLNILNILILARCKKNVSQCCEGCTFCNVSLIHIVFSGKHVNVCQSTNYDIMSILMMWQIGHESWLVSEVLGGATLQPLNIQHQRYYWYSHSATRNVPPIIWLTIATQYYNIRWQDMRRTAGGD